MQHACPVDERFQENVVGDPEEPELLNLITDSVNTPSRIYRLLLHVIS